MNRILATLCCILLLAGPVRAAGQNAVGRAAFDHTADQVVADARELKTVGGSMALIRDGKVVDSRTFGFADEARGQRVDADTIFHWASITKTVTAVGVMQLAERGLISLDDPVVKYIPEFAAVHDPYGPIAQVTLRHLLTHSSGLRDPTWPWNPDGAQTSPDWTRTTPTIGWDEVMAMLPYTGLAYPPGSRYSYSNPGYSLLGLVIERVTGDDVEAYLTKNVLMPLGMTRSYFDVTPYYLQPYRSNSYTWENGKRTENGREFDTGSTVANGGLNAPFGDMVRWLNFLAGSGDPALYERVLPRRTLLAMFDPLHPADYDPTVDERMGTGLFSIDAKGGDGQIRHYVGHTGSQEGYLSFFYFQPKTRTAVLFAVNTAVAGKARAFVFDSRRRFFETVFPVFDRADASR